MDIHFALAAGLTMCVAELRKRGNDIVIEVCANCQRLRLLHMYTLPPEFVQVAIPYDMVILDCLNRIIHGTTFKYGLAPDV